MQSIELTVKSLDDAAKTAAEQLGVSADQVTITVIEESKKLFGKVSYKVRAEAPDAPKAEVKEEAPKSKPAAKVAAPKVEATEEATPAPRKKLGAKKEEAAAEAPATEAVVTPAAKPSRATKAKPAEKVAAVESGAEGDAPVEAVAEEEAGPEVIATQEDADKLSEILAHLIEASGVDAQLHVGEIQGKYINLAIDGKEAGYFIGKSGEVLNSLQYLINLVAKQQLSNGVRVTLDGNDYRKKRADALTNLAVKISEKVIERGEEAVLEALPAFERRVIHKALQEIEGIITYSEGEEPDRRVVIAPAD
jgi:spoIIIJ-associated protein